MPTLDHNKAIRKKHPLRRIIRDALMISLFCVILLGFTFFILDIILGRISYAVGLCFWITTILYFATIYSAYPIWVALEGKRKTFIRVFNMTHIYFVVSVLLMLFAWNYDIENNVYEPRISGYTFVVVAMEYLRQKFSIKESDQIHASYYQRFWDNLLSEE